jgi:uncharacterized protein (TIGR01777 family)
MRVLMAGASGFLGSHLRADLAADGHEIVQLVRRPAAGGAGRSGVREVAWDPAKGSLDASALDGVDVVVNLAGAGVGDKRWSDSYRRVLVSSRVESTTTIAQALAALPASKRPRVLLNASAVGFYGDTGDTAVDESSGPGGGFFPELAQAWEAATAPAREAGVRVVLLRSGLVLDASGGLLRPFLITTRLFIGGPLAGGRHWMPWISMADWVGAVRFLIGREDISGPVNVAGPDPVRNKEFTQALGQLLHRPAPWPIPRFALRIVLGDFVEEAVASQRVLPGVLNRSGYTFQHPTVDSALRAAVGH